MWIDIAGRFWEPIKNFGPKIPILIVGLIAGILVIKILLVLMERTLKITRAPKALSGIVISLVAIVLWIMLFSEIARELGLSSVAITISGSLIVLGLALASGASNLTSDIISGVFIAKDDDFEVGFRVKSKDVEGVVQKIDIRKVRIVDDDNKLHIIPNTTLDKSGWMVIARGPKSDKIDRKRIYLKKKIR